MGGHWIEFGKQGPPEGVGPPEGGGQPPGQGPGGEGPPGPGGEGPPGPGGEGPPGQGNGNGNGGNPGEGPPIPDGNVPSFPTPAQWPGVYGEPWDENWWQKDYEIDVVVGSGQPPQDHYEPRHIGDRIHVLIRDRAAELYLSLEGYWKLMAKAHAAVEAEMENERGWSHPQQRFLRPKSESPPASYAGCLDCRGYPGCMRVHELLAKSRGKTNLIHRRIHGMGDDEINALMDDMHRYMTCVRADIWSHERAGIAKGREVVEKPYPTLESLPDAVKKLPKHGQEIYRAAFNASYEEFGESRAHAIAWAAVKNKYEQRDGRWVAKGDDVDEDGIRRSLAWIALDWGLSPPASWINLARTEQAEWYIPIFKADDEQRIVYGVVLEPGDSKHVDAQGDFVKAEEIEPAAHDFMQRYRKQRATLGEQHKKEAAVDIVESTIVPEDYEVEFQGKKQVVKAGSWVIGVKVLSKRLWKAVKEGKLTGFSIGGSGERVAAA